MPKFAANLTMLFTEYPVAERFDRAAAAGFTAVEFLYPYFEDTGMIRDALQRNNLELILFNHFPGDLAAGERGIANDPLRIAEFQEEVGLTLALAVDLGTKRLNCMAGLTLPTVPITAQWETLRQNLSFAAEQAAVVGIRQMVEPINTIDMPGFFLSTPQQGFALVEEIGHPNLAVQFDVFHAQRMEGNLTATIQSHIGQIGHIQVADCPDRHEPGSGEINYPWIFKVIDDAGYDGWVSLEYQPSGQTEESLGWLYEAVSS